MEALFPEDPRVIGPYRLLARLGEGGMGRVFLGRPASGRAVAVKVLHSELAREPHFRRRFRAEFEAARRVSGMWTAPVLGHDIESATPWVATGFVAGVTLRELVDTLHGPLPENSVWALAYGLSHALLAVRGAGLIHRDLKPSNVMVTLEGPKVIDFGIARSVEASVLTRTGGMVGTVGYMPPEQIRGEQELTGAVDVFAMGAVLAYAATGKSPFSWDDAQEHTVMYRVINHPPHLGPEDGRLKGDLRTLVLHCLAKDARERPALAGIPPMAERRAGAEYWLPPGLTAWLGQFISKLLEFEGPDADLPDGSWGQQPPSVGDRRPAPTPSRPLVGNSEPTQIPGESRESLDSRPSPPASHDAAPLPAIAPPLPSLPPPPAPPHTPPTGPQHPSSGRRWGRGRYALAAASGALALAVTSWLVLANMAGGEGNDEAGGGGDGQTELVETPSGEHGDNFDESAPLADRVPQDLRESGKLTVHVATAYDPIIKKDDETGRPVGWEVDLARAMGELLGVEIAFVLEGEEEQAAAEAAVDAGQEATTHIAMGAFVDDETYVEEWGVDFVNHYRDGLGVMSENPENSPRDLNELCGLAITTFESSADSMRDRVSHCTRPTPVRPKDGKDEMAEAIAGGEADVAVLNYSDTAYWAGEEGRDYGLGINLAEGEGGYRGIAVPAGQEELSDAIYKALLELMNDGTYNDLLDRWHIGQAALDGPDVNHH